MGSEPPCRGMEARRQGYAVSLTKQTPMGLRPCRRWTPDQKHSEKAQLVESRAEAATRELHRPKVPRPAHLSVPEPPGTVASSAGPHAVAAKSSKLK